MQQHCELGVVSKVETLYPAYPISWEDESIDVTKLPLGNCALLALCDVIGKKIRRDCMHCHALLTSITPSSLFPH